MWRVLFLGLGLIFVPELAFADNGDAHPVVDLTGTIWGITALALFVCLYSLVPLEHGLGLRKSKPVVLAAGLIWALVAIAHNEIGDSHTAHEAIQNNLLEYGELLLFLLAAMTYINSLQERNVFECLRASLVSRGFSLRSIFWITGVLAFCLSPIADNLTTALVMGAVVMAVGGSNPRFVVVSCVSIVVAANAGGAFSPFGDITTLMVWQQGKVDFIEFFDIFVPSAVNWIVPAFFMSLTIPKETPEKLEQKVSLKYGARVMMFLFLVTIATAVCFHNFLHLPPAAGMMLGLGVLGMFSYHVKRHEGRVREYDEILGAESGFLIPPVFVTGDGQALVSQIVDGNSQPALAIDAHHRVTHWNSALEELTGTAAEEVIGRTTPWPLFADKKRKLLADLVVDQGRAQEPGGESEELPRKVRRSRFVESGYESVEFLPKFGKWFSSAAAPIRTEEGHIVGAVQVAEELEDHQIEASHFDLMRYIARVEWDTLLFFYGVILSVGGLATFGYLALVSNFMYADLGPTVANTLVGVLSSVLDNIPVMFAVLTMDPEMSHGQWLLVTLTAGVGGSLLSIGSAAGVALMGTARGTYTFMTHLRWTPVIALGYAASIACHLFLNAHLM